MNEPTELIVLTFASEGRAAEVLKTIQQLITEGRVSVINMAVLVKHKDGKTTVKETQEVGPTRGAVFGAIVGGLIGLVGGPVGAVMGAAAGAATGGVAAYTIDLGFPAEYLAELKANLRLGSSAIIIFCHSEWSDRLIAAVSQFEGRVIRHAVKEEIGAYLAVESLLEDDQTLPIDRSLKLEAQIAAWQGEIDHLTAKLTANGVSEQAEERAQLLRMHTMQRLVQDKLIELLQVEISGWTEKIETLQTQVNEAEDKTALLSQLSDTRVQRRAVREKLYAQMELRLKNWQTEIDQLRRYMIALLPPASEIPTAAISREAALKTYLSTMNNPALPTLDNQSIARLSMLQAQVTAAETELLALQEEQIAVWQATLNDLQTYLATPGVPDQAIVINRIAELEGFIANTQARVKEQLKTELVGWQAEIEELQRQIAAKETASRAKVSERIAALQAEIDSLQAEAEASIAEDKLRATERIAALQAKIASSQTKL